MTNSYMRTLLIFCLIAGCAVTSDLPQDKIDQIPDGANRVDVYSDLSVEELSNQVKQFLIERDFGIAEESEITRRVETTGKDVGQRTMLKIVFRTSPYEQGSKLEAIGSWSSDVEEFNIPGSDDRVSSEDTDVYQVVWTGSGRGSFAYAQMVKLFDAFPSREVRYVKQ